MPKAPDTQTSPHTGPCAGGGPGAVSSGHTRGEVDVCLVLEGTYPYVTGGVSAWVHDILTGLPEIRFALVCLHAGATELHPRYELPANVVAVQNVHVQRLPPGTRYFNGVEEVCQEIEDSLVEVTTKTAGLDVLKRIMRAFKGARRPLGHHALLNSAAAWALLTRTYERNHANLSFIDYFWSWRTLIGGLYAGLLVQLPRARVYHAVSTGYAGLIAAQGGIENGAGVMLSEHGLYTNERRVELSMATWLHDAAPPSLALGRRAFDLRDLWINTFASYARICYEACDCVATLHEVNKKLQIADGAPASRIRVIPNGIDVPSFRDLRSGTAAASKKIAMIGRVVPIKDVASFVQACHLMADAIPEVRFEVMGPTDEEPDYFERCQNLVERFELGGRFTFRGGVNVRRELADVDVIVLTSISESQPLTILEAGAAGIPVVATDVGGCREMVMGRSDEQPRLGPGGAVVPVADPQKIADAIVALYAQPAWYARCSAAMRARVATYYDKIDMLDGYRALYAQIGDIDRAGDLGAEEVA